MATIDSLIKTYGKCPYLTSETRASARPYSGVSATWNAHERKLLGCLTHWLDDDASADAVLQEAFAKCWAR